MQAHVEEKDPGVLCFCEKAKLRKGVSTHWPIRSAALPSSLEMSEGKSGITGGLFQRACEVRPGKTLAMER